MQRHDANSVEPAGDKLDPANTIGRQFLVEYYNCLRSNFDSTLNYYSDASVVKRFGGPAVSGLANIRSELQKSKLAWDSVRIFETICIFSHDNSLVIQVSGEFVSQCGPRAFLQNVVLASQGPRKYYIGSDLLEWMDDLYPQWKKTSAVNVPHPPAHINGHQLASPHAPSPPEEPIQPAIIHQQALPQVYQVAQPLESSLPPLQTHIPQAHQQAYVQQPQHGISPPNLLTHPQQAHSMVPPQHQHPQARPQPQQISQQQQPLPHQIPQQQQQPPQMHERQQPQQQYQPQPPQQPVQHTQQQQPQRTVGQQQQQPQTFSQAVGAVRQQPQQHGGYQQRTGGPGGPPGLQQQQQQRQYGQYGQQQQQHPNNSGPPGSFNKPRYNGPRRGGPPRFQGGPPMNNGGPK